MEENNYYEGLMNRICVLYDALDGDRGFDERDSRKRKVDDEKHVRQMQGNQIFEVTYKVVNCNGQNFWQFVGAK